MVDANERLAQSERQALRRAQANQERARQTRPTSRRDRVEFAGGDNRFAKRLAGDRHEVVQVLARGEFRHYAAVLLMKFYLGGNRVGENTAIAQHGDTCFVTRRLDGQQQHGRRTVSLGQAAKSFRLLGRLFLGFGGGLLIRFGLFIRFFRRLFLFWLCLGLDLFLAH